MSRRVVGGGDVLDVVEIRAERKGLNFEKTFVPPLFYLTCHQTIGPLYLFLMMKNSFLVWKLRKTASLE